MKQAASIKVGKATVGYRDVKRRSISFYTANGLSNDISIWNIRANGTVATIAAGTRPWGVTIVE